MSYCWKLLKKLTDTGKTKINCTHSFHNFIFFVFHFCLKRMFTVEMLDFAVDIRIFFHSVYFIRSFGTTKPFFFSHKLLIY